MSTQPKTTAKFLFFIFFNECGTRAPKVNTLVQTQQDPSVKELRKWTKKGTFLAGDSLDIMGGDDPGWERCFWLQDLFK